MPAVRVGNTAHFIAIHLVQDTNLEHQIMDKQEEHAPLNKGDIKALYALFYKRGFIVQVLQREEIACRDEEKGHVEFEDEVAEPARCLSMGYHHQDNGNAFADRYIRNTIHGILRKNVSGVNVMSTRCKGNKNKLKPI